MEKINIEGFDLDVDVTEEGMFEVYMDGELKGRMLLVEPPPPEKPDEPVFETYTAPAAEADSLPLRWYRTEDGVLMRDGVWDQENERWTGGEPVNSAAVRPT